MSEIWSAVGGHEAIQPISGQGFRLVECQETIATTEIVSTLENQAVLEEMLDAESKPRHRAGTEHLHYLLSTPFRYPPLQHGSRFGGRFEPSLFYGGTSEYVTLCESAFYRFYFYYDMETPPLNDVLQTQHSLFKFRYKTNLGVKLQCPPFDVYNNTLRDPNYYTATQTLGVTMREAGIKGFEYRSARDQDGGINVALFDATPLTTNKPLNVRSCLCETGHDKVTFSLDRKITLFILEQFQVNGTLPTPAA